MENAEKGGRSREVKKRRGRANGWGNRNQNGDIEEGRIMKNTEKGGKSRETEEK